MFIEQLKFNGFRCYESVDLVFDNKINIFHGANGSGKTSVLEAIYWLSTGKSFRSKKNKVLVNINHLSFVLYSKFKQTFDSQPQHLGISFDKTSLKKQIKLNHSSINQQSAIAHVLPVVAIDPESYLFIDKGPQFRRSFLDWLVFHVKHEYLNVWTHTTRCHKQLNALYKSQDRQQLPEWERQYVQYANHLNQLRNQVFTALESKVEQKIMKFLPELIDFNIQYHQGWLSELTLAELLIRENDKNLRYGNLYSGVHKMDIRCKVGQHSAHEVLSRGQKKIIAIIFYLSFIELLTEATGFDPLVCLDDLDAELDGNKTDLLCDFINRSNNQFFITTVDKMKMHPLFSDVSMFHVKHGNISKD